MQISLRQIVAFSGGTDTVAGVVACVAETNMTVNDEVIHRVGFGNLVAGNEFHGMSYLRYPPEQTSTVAVEYFVSALHLARIDGGSYAPFGGMAFMAAIFPLMGLMMIAFPFYANFRRLQLMRHGEVAQGRLENAEDTNISVNGEKVVRFRFVFTDKAGRQHRLTFRTHETERITDGQTEAVLYLEAKPAVACLLDTLPGAAKLQGDGSVHFDASFSLSDLLATVMIILAIIPAFFF